MVDFQSRDTRRGPPVDDETEADDAADEADDDQPQPAEADEGGATASEAPTHPAEADEGSATASEAPTHPTEADPSGAESDPLADDPVATSAPDTPDSTRVEESDTDGDAGGVGPAHSEPTAAETAPKPDRSVDVAVVTVDTPEDSGVEDALTTAFESAGHEITVHERLRGEYDTLQQVLDRLVGRGDVDVVVTAGGVGIGPDAVTIEAVHPLLEKALPGFGEAFRSLLFDTVGTGIVGVRSTAGVADGTPVFCLPGDTDAVTVAVEEILAAEAPALVEQLRE